MFVQKGGGDPPPIPDFLDLFPFHTEVMKEVEHCRHNARDARRAGRHPSAEVQFPDGLEEVVKWCQNGQVTRGLLKQKQPEPLTLYVYGISIYVHMSFPTSKLNYVACSESIFSSRDVMRKLRKSLDSQPNNFTDHPKHQTGDRSAAGSGHITLPLQHLHKGSGPNNNKIVRRIYPLVNKDGWLGYHMCNYTLNHLNMGPIFQLCDLSRGLRFPPSFLNRMELRRVEQFELRVHVDWTKPKTHEVAGYYHANPPSPVIWSWQSSILDFSWTAKLLQYTVYASMI